MPPGPEAMPQTPTYSIIVLAAGRSTRMVSGNKLLAVLGGEPVVGRTIRAAAGSGVGEVIVVTGHEAAAVAEVAAIAEVAAGVDAAGEFRTRIVYHSSYDDGMASSLAEGIRSAEASNGYLILPGDMPLVQPETIRKVAGHFSSGRIVVPTFEGRRGHPVLFASTFRGDLLRLTGDAGARPVLERHAEFVSEIAVEDPGILTDVETCEDLDRIASIIGGESPSGC